MPRHSAGLALGRLACEECGAALVALRSRRGIHVRVHEARKAVRRTRALLALVRDSGADLALEPLDAALRRLGDSLSQLRDAHVATETAKALCRDDDRRPWRPVASALRIRAQTLVERERIRDPGFGRRCRSIERVLAQLQQQPWQDISPSQVRAGLQRQQQRVARAERRARHHPDAERLHDWRRKVRRLRMQLDALPRLGPHAPKAHAPAKARALHRLADALGLHQDRHVLSQLLTRLPGIEDRAGLRARLTALDAAAS